jgi:glucose-6-phosphate 1-dehydrogenase
LGYARTPHTDDEFRQIAAESIREHGSAGPEDEIWKQFISGIFYQPGDYTEVESFERLRVRVDALDLERGTEGNHLYDLATPPEVVVPITAHMNHVGLCHSDMGGWTRIIIEKPFGHDLQSAQDLNRHLLETFTEEQIFRIDHYLGKETVQNILAFRFGNGIFEPIWNRNYVNHVQITVAETLDIGNRGGYYDRAGALRDMVQNHVMQLIALTAMEPPVALDAKSVRDQKVNVLRSIERLDPHEVDRFVVRGQYAQGTVKGKQVSAYLETGGVAAGSTTETFVAWKIGIDNWRWNGVPFYVRTGKALAAKTSEINIVFRKPPLLFYESVDEPLQVRSNVLKLSIQPDESISLTFVAKRPGSKMQVERVHMDFSYSEGFGAATADAYERLLLDALQGDSTLFIRRDETEVAWDRVTQVLDGWAHVEEVARRHGGAFRLPQYEPGSWGPPAAEELMRRDGHYWRND